MPPLTVFYMSGGFGDLEMDAIPQLCAIRPFLWFERPFFWAKNAWTWKATSLDKKNENQKQKQEFGLQIWAGSSRGDWGFEKSV